MQDVNRTAEAANACFGRPGGIQPLDEMNAMPGGERGEGLARIGKFLLR
jgi:hypothetical protein